MNESKFNLWRACFAFCYVDSHLSSKEQEWISEKIKILKFTPEQKKQIDIDLKNPPDIFKILPLVTSPADKGMLVNMIRQLAFYDKDFSAEESEKIDAVKDKVLANINMGVVELSIHEACADPIKTRHSLIEKVVDLMIDD